MSGDAQSGPPAEQRLPRELESDPCLAAVRGALSADVRMLWPRGTLGVPSVPLTPTLRAALAALAAQRRLERGLEAADATLAAEQRGLAALAPAVAARQQPRVSRVLVVSNDGAERFYRQVERLALAHAPRVLVCRVEAPSAALGEICWGAEALAKLVLTTHKTATTDLLRALAGS